MGTSLPAPVIEGTLNLEQAASYLMMCTEQLRRKASSKKIPAGKMGKRWVFLKQDLDNVIRSQYSNEWQALLSEPTEETDDVT